MSEKLPGLFYDPEFITKLACPAEDHGALVLREGQTPQGAVATLTCQSCGREYLFAQGIPVLLTAAALEPVAAKGSE